MKIPYVLLDFSGEVKTMDSQWDMTLIRDMLEGKTWQPAQGYEFQLQPAYKIVDERATLSGAVIVIPGRQNSGHEDEIQKVISELEWCVIILVGDEERSFDKGKLNHPNMKVWLMHPTLDDKADFYLGSGYTPHVAGLNELPFETPDKPLDWFFAGQVNHIRRDMAVNVLTRMLDREDLTGELSTSDGFTKGLRTRDYNKLLMQAKAIPCPSGIESPDSFRVYEALEVGAVPVADEFSRKVQHPGYWSKVFNDEDIPFKVFSDYDNFEGYIADVAHEYPKLNQKVFAWWQGYKKRIVYQLSQHVHDLSGIPYPADELRHKITVIVVTSPIKSHPSTAIIDQTIQDLRKVLPDCEILIGIDGVREEQREYTERYEEYKQQLLWKCHNEWTNVLPVVFEVHKHQAAMTRELLRMVHTPTMLFVEHDTALCPDFDYEWLEMLQMIEEGEAYTIRFHHEATIPEEHEHLMAGPVEDIFGLKMRRTAQWSQRPHLSSTTFYRDMMDRFFSDDSRTMIEDKVHGYPAEAWANDGLQGWYQWRIWIYHPKGQIKRSYTTDGRGDDPKYEMRF